MICPNCGKELKDGSKFCQFCGGKVQAVQPPVDVYPEPVPEPVSAPKSGGGAKIGLIAVAVVAVLLLALNAVQYLGLVDLGSPYVGDLQARLASAEADAEEMDAQLSQTQADLDATRNDREALLEENAALNQQMSDMETDAAAAENAVVELQALVEELQAQIRELENDATAAQLQQQVDSLNAALTQKDQSISSLEAKVKELEAKIKSLQQSAGSNNSNYNNLKSDYDRIISAMKGNVGAASDRFRVSKGCIVMKKSASPVNVTLTADFNAYVTVTTNRSGSSADMTFNQSSWSGTTTTLKVTPKSVGITTVTFTNSIDNQTFTVIIIVTE